MNAADARPGMSLRGRRVHTVTFHQPPGRQLTVVLVVEGGTGVSALGGNDIPYLIDNPELFGS